jgi:hypothetical protein
MKWSGGRGVAQIRATPGLGHLVLDFSGNNLNAILYLSNVDSCLLRVMLRVIGGGGKNGSAAAQARGGLCEDPGVWAHAGGDAPALPAEPKHVHKRGSAGQLHAHAFKQSLGSMLVEPGCVYLP